MKVRWKSTLILLAAISFPAIADAGILRQYNAPVDPASVGFSLGGFGSFSAGPISNDLARPAWRTTINTLNAQRSYLAGGFSAAELSDIATDGFTWTLDARVLRNIGGSHTMGNPQTLLGFSTNFNGRRWDIGLGLDTSDNTVAVLTSSIDVGGAGGSVRNFGTQFVLPGNGYHRYQLVYDPTANNADFFIDGTKVFDDYDGTTSFVGSWSLGWGTHGGGQSHVSFAQLTTGDSATVPEPAGIPLLGIMLTTLLLNRRSRSDIAWMPLIAG